MGRDIKRGRPKRRKLPHKIVDADGRLPHDPTPAEIDAMKKALDAERRGQ